MIPIATWYNGSAVTNPANGTILITTGPLTAGYYIPQFLVATAVTGWFSCIQFDGTGSAAKNFDIRMANNETQQIEFTGGVYVVGNGGFRITVLANLTGVAIASIVVRAIGKP